MRKVLIILIGIVLLAGCASVNEKTLSDQIHTNTEVNLISSTPEPSFTKTPTITLTSTKTTDHSTATLTPSITPTWDGASWRWVSPNGEYIAARYDSGHGDIHKPLLEITDYEGNLLHQIICNKDLPQGDPQKHLTVFGWSADSNNLYYGYVQGVDGGDMTFWWTGHDLRSINIENGYDQAVIPGEGAMSFAFSPDESQIIYSLASDPAGVIHLLNFESDKNIKIYVDPVPQKFKRIGDFQWSPNGEGIVFQTEEEWLRFESGAVYMEVQTVYLNAQTLAQKLINRGAMYDYQPDSWVDDETILVRTYDQGFIWVDIITGEVGPALSGTKTPTPTITLRPTRTITPTFTISPTKTVTSTITPPLPTYSAYPDSWQQGPWIRKWSPDGKFLVEIYDYNGHGDIHGPVIEIFDQNNNMLWKIPYEGDTSGIYPYVSMHFLKWSLNGSELYYYTMFHGSGGDYVFKANGCDLSKIDLYTGEIQPLFPEGDGSAAFSVTNDGGRMVYSFFGENVDTVYIHNFWTGLTSSIILDPATQPYEKIGDFHWSPDGKGIVFQTEAKWLEFENGGVYIEVQTVYLNTISMEQKLIHRDSIYTYMLEDWIDDRTIRIHKINNELNKTEVYAVDIFTGNETLLPDATPEW